MYNFVQNIDTHGQEYTQAKTNSQETVDLERAVYPNNRKNPILEVVWV
jgi:hypothetical protein